MSNNNNTPKFQPPVAGRPSGEPITNYPDFYDRAFKLQLDQGAEESDAKSEAVLTASAAKSAECLAAAPYDPEGNIADRLMEERRQRDLAELRNLEQEVAHARADLRDRERELAAMGDPPIEPESSIMVALLVVLAVSVTMTLTFHDLVFAKLFAATNQAILAAAVCGIFISGLVAWGLLASAKFESTILVHCLAVGACFLFGAALLALRLAGAHGERDHWLAYGFAGVELASLLILEVYAHGLRREWKRFRIEKPAFAAAEQQVVKAKSFLDDRLADRDACRARLLAHDDKVAERESLVRSAGLVKAALEETSRLGSRHGAAVNYGHLHGRIAPPPSRAEVIKRSGGNGAFGERAGKKQEDK